MKNVRKRHGIGPTVVHDLGQMIGRPHASRNDHRNADGIGDLSAKFDVEPFSRAFLANRGQQYFSGA